MMERLARVKLICQVVLLLTVTAAVGNLWWNLRLQLQQLGGKASTTLSLTNKTLLDVGALTTSFKQQQDSVEVIRARRDLQLAGAAGVQHFTYVTLPKLDSNLDELRRGSEQLSELARAGAVMVTNTDKEVNSRLLPEVTAQVKQLGELTKTIELIARGGELQVNTVTAALNELLNNGTITVQQLNARLADPKLNEIVIAALSTTQHLDNTLASLEASAAELPPMFKFARKAQKPLTYLQILSVLAKIFKPL